MNTVVDAAAATGDDPVWDPLASRESAPVPDGAALVESWSRRDELSLRLLLEAIQRMGVFRQAGQEWRVDQTDELGIAPQHRELWEALLAALVDARLLEQDGEVFRATSAVEETHSRDLAAESARLVARHPEVSAQMRLVQACLAQYPRLLRGEAKPTSVLFPGWSMELVEGVYRGDPVSDRLNQLAAEAVAARVGTHTGSAPPRLLEAGAGTGGSAAQILATVPPGTDGLTYVYTDVSPSFLRHGQRRFGTKYTGMEFRRLDIESDPAAQGFDAGEFDIVVAANVLHATKNLRSTLAIVRGLLRDGGWLVLREITNPLLFTTMTFGLLEGWWLSQDRAVRIPRSPLADAETWRALLTEAGFRRVAVLAPTEVGGQVLGQHVLVAEA
ncbi:methyltransferase [Streptomyces sp. 7R007]